MIRGGGQERGRRAGTENLPGIAGFARGRRRRAAGLAEYDRVRRLRDKLEAAALAAVPEAHGHRRRCARACRTRQRWRCPELTAETQVIALDLDGVMVSAGAACSSGKVGPSHVLAAMGLPPGIAGATIRISLGWTTTEADIAHFLKAWTALARRRRRGAQRRMSSVAHAIGAPTGCRSISTTSRRRRSTRACSTRCCRISPSSSATRPARATSTARRPTAAVEAARADVAAADRRRPARDRVHLGRDRGQQPGAQGRGAFRPRPPASRTRAARPHRHPGDRAQMRARKRRRAGARGFRDRLLAGRAERPRVARPSRRRRSTSAR